MGKRILVQRKGHGNLWARSPSHRHVGTHNGIKYRPFNEKEKLHSFRVLELVHAPGRGAPIALVKYDDGQKGYWLPPEGIYEGEQFIQSKTGYGQEVTIGSILPLKKVPLGTLVFNVEGTPQDGGKFARASGVAAIVQNRSKDKVQLLFRSKKSRWFHESCLCTVGVVAGGGRTDKPFLKAGNKFHSLQSKAAKWPVVRGSAMNASDHPFGGGRHKHPHISTTTSRNAPPGRKVGLIAARRTGYRK